MTRRIYCIKDRKAGVISSAPMLFENDNVAIRWFHQVYADAVDRDRNSALASYPEDFELVSLGEFDLASGVIDSDGGCMFVCAANKFSCMEV